MVDYVSDANVLARQIRQYAFGDQVDPQVAERLQSIPGVSSGPFGTTPDSIKASPEYKKAKSEYESAFQGLRAINSVLNSKFKKQYMAHIRAKREAELKGME